MTERLPRFTWEKDELDFFGTPVPVYLPDNITLDQLNKFKGFRDWKETTHQNLERQASDPKHAFHAHPYSLKSIEVQSVDRFPNGNIGFMKINASVEREPIPEDNQTGSKPKISKNLPGIAFLRGGSVAMLMILRPKDSREERYVVLTEQPRLPAGSMQFLEIPAGMLDKEQNFSGAAAKEIEEETGFKIPLTELVDMTALALANSKHPEESLKSAMYPSPGGCDEYIVLFLWEKELDRQEIEDLRGRLTGERTQDEMITLQIQEYEYLWREGARDAKTLAAWALYEGLSRSGELQRYQKWKRESTTISASPQEQAKRTRK